MADGHAARGDLWRALPQPGAGLVGRRRDGAEGVAGGGAAARVAEPVARRRRPAPPAAAQAGESPGPPPGSPGGGVGADRPRGLDQLPVLVAGDLQAPELRHGLRARGGGPARTGSTTATPRRGRASPRRLQPRLVLFGLPRVLRRALAGAPRLQAAALAGRPVALVPADRAGEVLRPVSLQLPQDAVEAGAGADEDDAGRAWSAR